MRIGTSKNAKKKRVQTRPPEIDGKKHQAENEGWGKKKKKGRYLAKKKKANSRNEAK